MARATRLGLALFGLLVPLLATASPALGRVIVVHVAQTDDPRIGKDCAIDLRNVRDLFGRYPAMDRVTEFIAIQGRDVNHAAIMDRLRSLRVGPDDAVLFYYSGHGAEDPGARENYGLLADGRALRLSQVSKAIAAKNPRLNIVIADMCSVVERPRRPPADAGETKKGIRADLPPALRSLFLTSRGAAVVISSSVNQVAVGDIQKVEGGIFTSAFTAAIHDKINQDLTWREVFADAARQTHQKFVLDNPRGIDGRAAGIPGIGVQRTQTPNVVRLDISSGGGEGEGGGGGPTRPVFGARVRNNGGDGVVVLSVAAGGPAERAGIERSDVLLELNGVALRSMDDYARIIDSSGPELHVVYRNGRDRRVYSKTIQLNK